MKRILQIITQDRKFDLKMQPKLITIGDKGEALEKLQKQKQLTWGTIQNYVYSIKEFLKVTYRNKFKFRIIV